MRASNAAGRRPSAASAVVTSSTSVMSVSPSSWSVRYSSAPPVPAPAARSPSTAHAVSSGPDEPPVSANPPFGCWWRKRGAGGRGRGGGAGAAGGGGRRRPPPPPPPPPPHPRPRGGRARGGEE